MITTKEFDQMFDNKEDISKYIDYNSPLTKEDLIKMLEKRENEQLTIEITKELKDKLEEKAKKLGLKIQDAAKVLLSKELGLI